MLFRFLIALNILMASGSYAYANEAQNSPRFIVHLLDYLAKDYAGAVSEDGKVLSKSEYSEQIEFAQSALKTAKELPELKVNQELQAKIALLLKEIEAKAAPKAVAPLARELQQKVIALTGIELQPAHWPSLNSGQKMYAQSCVVCHGTTGRGDGPGGKGLDPAPANFVDKDGMKALTPFAAFNTIRLGVPGTGMVAFLHLSDQEVWELAFYINSLRFNEEKASELPSEWATENKDVLKRVAALSDEALKEQIKGSEAEKNKTLASLRLFLGKENQDDFLNLAATKLDEANTNYTNGNFELSKANALQAYLEGIEPIEAKLRATDPESVVEIEEKMSAVRGAIENKKTSIEVSQLIDTAKQKITEIKALIHDKKMSPWLAFLSAFAIILREGFEAVLIVLALLSVTRAANSKKATSFVHGGWLVAVFVGVVAWFFSGWVMQLSGAGREKLEGFTSIFAVIVLSYVGFWLHRQTEIGRWKTFLEVKVKSLISGEKLLGLAVISFIAVFREALETVLFLRAIWLDLDNTAKAFLFSGVMSSMALVIILSWIALNYSKKLPLKTLFNLSGFMMLVLATVLAGKGIHSLQEAGMFGVDAFPLRIRFELLGLYPTVQTITAQILTAMLVLFLWTYGKKPSLEKVRG